jgi:hypothetical protein
MGMFKSSLSGKDYLESEKVSAYNLKSGVLAKIKEDYPQFNERDCLSLSELNTYQNKYVSAIPENEVGTLGVLEKEVLEALHKNSTISDNVNQVTEKGLTYGQRLADRIATFGGSSTFILSFFFMLFCWIGINIGLLN